ncbi:MAG: UDP-N-acetylmuramate dehydrogenase [Bacteroidetes bacterium]|nr:UDP-N-acetylmuramate dehydrogenase [Bacteroidota bacterium]
METRKKISLKPFNTFHLDVLTDLFSEIQNLEDLQKVISDPELSSIPKLILGGGSNLLFTNDFHGIVLKNNLKGIQKIKEDDDSVFIQSGSGEAWNDLVMYCIENNYAGIENMSLIPGTVGAAPIQNIGAYGVELKEVFEELEAVHLKTGEVKLFRLADCRFGYRDSIFKNELKNEFMIVKVTLRLSKHPVLNTSYGAIETELKAMGVTDKNIRAISKAVCNIRLSKLPNPDQIGNAGSFFKNPEVSSEKYESLKKDFPELVAHKTQGDKMKLAAGWLIEHCGWKGKQVGNVGMHKSQALVLVNYGHATGDELFAHAKTVQLNVKEKFGVEMEMEVNVI